MLHLTMVTLEGYSFLLDHVPSGISMYILATRAGVDCHIAATGDADLVRAVRSQIAAAPLGDLLTLRQLVNSHIKAVRKQASAEGQPKRKRRRPPLSSSNVQVGAQPKCAPRPDMRASMHGSRTPTRDRSGFSAGHRMSHRRRTGLERRKDEDVQCISSDESTSDPAHERAHGWLAQARAMGSAGV